eukprot:CAMPEP_0119308312 /NCGR_PEP_ID=MMETSP1333-20130426/9977_1 /TAXON_ID=418940 /ORGANISM="Scyphosphaera apsteinii, Strain RCC1455" /LENGTH=166 /DNA_ID=CAMNT_0007312055 /DNA_START=26 /DNA_END=526 /DNA_ORIENTATION=+
MAEAAQAIAAVSLNESKRANHKQPPGRVRHAFKKMDKDQSGGVSYQELLDGLCKDFKVNEFATHVKEKMEKAFNEHAAEDDSGTKVLSAKVFSRFYCEVLFAHYDVDNSGTLQLAEVQKALAHLVKPNANGVQVPPTVAYPPEFTGSDGEVHLPIQWFWPFFSAME